MEIHFRSYIYNAKRRQMKKLITVNDKKNEF